MTEKLLTRVQNGESVSTLATYARIQHYGDMSPDPRTATCAQHGVASPYSDTAKGDGMAIPASLGWDCVVCPVPDSDLIGTPVIVAGYGSDTTFTYGGELGRPGTQVAFSLRGLPSVVRTAVGDVAPAATPVNVKDPRITVEKLAKKRNYSDSGLWLPAINHPALRDRNLRAEKTKKDALDDAAVRLAVAVYHDTRNQ